MRMKLKFKRGKLRETNVLNLHKKKKNEKQKKKMEWNLSKSFYKYVYSTLAHATL